MIPLNRQEAVFSWSEYVRDIANRMRLHDYEIGLSDQKSSDEASAEVTSCDCRRTAVIYLSDTFLTIESPQEQRRIIVHELLHAHFHLFDGMVRNSIPSLDQQKLVDMAFEVALEEITRVIAPSMPLPGKSKKRGLVRNGR